MSIEQIEVCGHRVLLEPIFPKTETDSGIVVVTGESAKREKSATQEGYVVRTGPMAWRAFDGDNPEWKPWAKSGDKVIFAKHAGKFIKVNEKEYIVINDEDIQCVIKEVNTNG